MCALWQLATTYCSSTLPKVPFHRLELNFVILSTYGLVELGDSARNALFF